MKTTKTELIEDPKNGPMRLKRFNSSSPTLITELNQIDTHGSYPLSLFSF